MTLWLIVIEGLLCKRGLLYVKKKKKKKGFEPIKFLHAVLILCNKQRSVVAAVKSFTFCMPLFLWKSSIVVYVKTLCQYWRRFFLPNIGGEVKENNLQQYVRYAEKTSCDKDIFCKRYWYNSVKIK